jgi:hypothetical protein
MVCAGIFWVAHCKSLSQECMDAYTSLLLALGMANEKAYTPIDVAILSERILVALVRVEASLPCSELDMKLHSVLHMPKRILDAGPLMGVSMWLYESMWKKLLSMRGNNAYPEQTMINIFALLEVSWLEFNKNPALYSSRLHIVIPPDHLIDDDDVQSVQLHRPEDDYHRHKMATDDRHSIFDDEPKSAYFNVVQKTGSEYKKVFTPLQVQRLHMAYLCLNERSMDMWEDFMPWLLQKRFVFTYIVLSFVLYDHL